MPESKTFDTLEDAIADALKHAVQQAYETGEPCECYVSGKLYCTVIVDIEKTRGNDA